MSRCIASAAFVLFLLLFAACNRQAEVAPIKNAQPERPVVVLTPEAVRQVLRFCDEQKIKTRWRLRVEVKDLGNGKGRHLVDLDPGTVGPDDLEYEFEGIPVVIARSHAPRLLGSTVGYRVDGVPGFYVDNPTLPDSRERIEEKPPKGRGDYAVVLKTSKGPVVIEVYKSWAPNAATRFRELTVSGYYDGCKFYRVVKDFTAQCGVNGDPKVTARWTERPISDDPPKMENVRGTVCMARSGAANSATTQFFINTKDNLFLKGQGYAPFGFVTEGIEVIDSLYSNYGECVPLGGGPDQRRVIAEGESYLKAEFPLLDQVNSATSR